MRHYLRPSLSVFGLLLALLVPSLLLIEAAHSESAPAATRQPASGDAAERIRQNYGRLPLSFEANRGQADARVRFLARSSAYSVYLTADEIALTLRDASAKDDARGESERADTRASVLRIKLLGASRAPRAYGLEELEGKSNYLVGSDPARWRTNVPHYGKVRYEGVYPGVDVVYYGTQRQLEYDFNLAPGADARRIRLRVEGAKGTRVDANGDLVLPTDAGEIRQRAPHAYQEIDGARQTIPSRYVMRGKNEVGFELGAYDRGRPLVIDPVIGYSTYLGGGGYDEGYAVAVDAQGNAYVTGFATSWNFPVTPNAPQQTRGGAQSQTTYDAVVTKLNPDGTALVYSTYIGGSRDEFSTSIAVDGAGQAHVAGWTASTNFPTTPGAFRTASAGAQEVFVSKLNADGTALLYSSYIGGSGSEHGASVALGSGGEIYVAGQTTSSNFPVTPGSFKTQPGGIPPDLQDGFVMKLSAQPGAGLLFSTYLGGTGSDAVHDIAVAAGLDDSVYVTGNTISTDFPVTPNAFQTAAPGGGSNFDAYVTRLNSNGTAAVFSTYLGGSGDLDSALSIAVGTDGTAYVAGSTYSYNFPVTPGAFQSTHRGAADAFVTRLGADGASLNYSTYFGGNSYDRAWGLAVDAQGDAYVVGETESYGLPTTPGAPGPNHAGGYVDGLFFKLNAAGTGVRHATYIGGTGLDTARGVAVGAGGASVYLTGVTSSPDFPTTPGAFQPQDPDAVYNDGFVTRLVLADEGGTHTVSGRATNSQGSPLSDVEVTVYSPFDRTVLTDADGNYTIEGLPHGAEVRLYATRFGATLMPVDAVIPNISQDETINFSGNPPLRISGRLVYENGVGVSVPLVLTGTVTQSLASDYDGRFSFIVPAGGSYTVTPGSVPGYVFVPQSHSVSAITADQTLHFVAERPPRIIGRVVHHEYNYGLPDIKVTLTSPSLQKPLVQTTDSNGQFSFDQLTRGATYTVKPSDPVTNRSFSPAQAVISNIQGEQFAYFTGLQPLAIHGRVTDPNGNAVTGTATLTGTVSATTEVDQWGHFDFFNLPRGGSYTVTVTKPGSLYTFSPPSQSATNLQDFQAFEFTALPPLRIAGHVAEAGSYGPQGVRATLTLTGTVNATTEADEWGFFEFSELPRGGNYKVKATYPHYTFEPFSHSVTGAQEDQFFNFEALPPLHIFGTLFDGNGGGVAGATVALSGSASATTVTDEYGNYNFPELPRGGSYTVTPAHDLYTFTPPSAELPAMSQNQVVTFQSALRRFTLSGRAADSTGAPLAGVSVALGGSGSGVTQTDANGNYSFANLSITRHYSVAAARPGFAFAPEIININDPRGDQTANFNGARLTYTISGRFTDGANGAGVEGATVTLGGGHSATTQTDAQGNYAFAGLPSEGDYALTLSHPHFLVGLPNIGYNNLLGDIMAANFSGARKGHHVSGRVTDAAGNALGGVTVTLSGAQSATTETDGLGQYTFSTLLAGFDYAITAAKTHYTFNPPTRQLEDLGADTAADFTATLLRHNINGRVVDANGDGFAGATVQLVGPVTGTVNTGADGNYSFTGLPAGGNYTVQPSRQFYDFGPVRGIFNDLGADQTANFTATLRTFSIGGRVAEGANGVAGVTVNLGGTLAAATQTDAAGNYLFASLPANGVYTVAPAAHPFFTFSPGSAPFNTLPSNQTANFAATRRLYQVSGSTLDLCGSPVAGITMALTHDGLTATAQSNAAGLFSFNGVQAGYNYTLAPNPSAYTYAPTSHLFPALGANQTGSFSMRPPTSTADVFALADLYVRGGTSAGSNFGTSTQLVTRLASQTSSTYETYLKFDLGQRCMASAVKLRLYGQLSSSGTMPVALYAVSSTTWTETGTTWNNKPAAGTLLRTVNLSGTTAKWYEWDVTDYVRSELAAGRRVVSFVLKSTSSTNYQATFTSRQASGTNAPRLAVTTP